MLIFKKDGFHVDRSSTKDSNQHQAKSSATEMILKQCEAAPGRDFTAKLSKVLEVWPQLANEWYREKR